MSNGSMPNATQLLYLLLLFTKHSIVYTFHCDSKCLYSSILKGKCILSRTALKNQL